jgi:hypothetical protein
MVLMALIHTTCNTSTLAQQQQQQQQCSTSALTAGSPFIVPNSALIGHYDINVPIPSSSNNKLKPWCCATNYTAAWDLNGELLAFSVDNLLCHDFVRRVREDALSGSRGVWDTYEDLLARKHMFMDPSDKGQGAEDILRIQSKYTGFFPGQTKLGVSDSVQMAIRSCLEPVVDVLLASPMFQNIEQDRIPRRLRDVPIHINDNDNNNNNNNNDNDNSSQQNRNPMIPMLGSNFYASASMLPEDMHVEHQWPHPDSFVPGLASVYTITEDTKYDVTGTAVVYQPVTNISIVNSVFGGGNSGGTIATSNQAFRDQSLRLTKQAPPGGVGWLNQSSNRYAQAIVVALNKHNRITLYPWNRLHFAYIPSRGLLSDNPRLGRLTLNAFWDVHGETRDPSSKSNFCQDLNRHYGAVSNGQVTLREKCQKCVAWRGCSWCVGESSCHSRSEAREICRNSATVAALGKHRGPLSASTSSCEVVDSRTVEQQTLDLSAASIEVVFPQKDHDSGGGGGGSGVMAYFRVYRPSTGEKKLTAHSLLSISRVQSLCYDANLPTEKRRMLMLWVSIVKRTERAVQRHRRLLKTESKSGSGDSRHGRGQRQWIETTQRTMRMFKKKVAECLQLLDVVYP